MLHVRIPHEAGSIVWSLRENSWWQLRDPSAERGCKSTRILCSKVSVLSSPLA